MFGVRVFVAQNICLLYLSISSCIPMLRKIFFLGGGIWNFWKGNFPPDVPRINPVCRRQCCTVQHVLDNELNERLSFDDHVSAVVQLYIHSLRH